MTERELVLNKGLRAVSEMLKQPWDVARPGEHIEPLVRDDDADSQAPTVPASRESTPAPPWVAPSEGPAPAQRQPSPAPAPRPGSRRQTPGIPETVPEEPAPKRKRRPPPAPTLGEPERELVAEAPADTKPPPAPRRRDDPAQGLVRRARAASARRDRPAARITPGAYDAVDALGRFGLLECTWGDRPLPGPGETLLVAHTPPRRDPAGLLALRPGDTLEVLSARPGVAGGGRVRIRFITRTGYFSPGRPITSVALGVPTAEWALALRGQPAS
jgi:hypothetical protein